MIAGCFAPIARTPPDAGSPLYDGRTWLWVELGLSLIYFPYHV